MMQKLTSSNAALIRSLVREKTVRDAEMAFVLEGAKPLDELLQSHADSFQALVVSDSGGRTYPALPARARQVGCPVYMCQDRVFKTLSDLSTPTGILGVLRRPTWHAEAIFRRPQLFGFYGEGLQDPANVGPIIRTAVAFGIDALWLSLDSVDVFNPKVVRATAGALLKLPILSITDIARFSLEGCALLAAESPQSRTRPIHEIHTRPARAVVAFGNESRGLSPATIQQAAIRFYIPIRPDAESLNVAAAAAIVAFFFSRSTM